MAVLTYLKLMWRYSPGRSLLLFFLLLVSSVTEGIGLVLLVPILGVLQETQTEPTGVIGVITSALSDLGIPFTLFGLLGVFLALNVLRAIIMYVQSIVSERFRLSLLDDLRAKSFDAILGARWDWVTAQKKSDLSSLLINEINRIGSALSLSVRLVVSVISIAAYVAAAMSLSPLFAVIALAMGALVFVLMRRQHSLAHKQGQLLSEANKLVQQTVEEGLSGLKLIKILRSEGRHSLHMRDIRSTLKKRKLQFMDLSAAMAMIFQVLAAMIMVGLLLFGVKGLDLELSTLLILVLIFARLAPQIRIVQTQINGVLHSHAVIESYENLIQRAGQAKEAEADVSEGTSVPFNQEIALKNIFYSYQSRQVTSLKDVSLTIKAHKTTAIMGSSGSGKSTLADVIMGLLPPDQGNIEIDGRRLSDANRLTWRKSIAYMPQDVFLFHDTIRRNLLWADDAASDAELMEALQNASANFVLDLPEQLDTIVGDAGQRLSGGEKQRIALARAMLQKPELLILDEATSALDLKNETRIRETIGKLHEKMTVIIIGHRLPALGNADQLIVLENGQVKASDGWNEVMPQVEI